MDFQGSQQTCYSDWARMVITFYPDIKFKNAPEEDKVLVFSGEEEIAFFNFGNGTGYILNGTNKEGLTQIGKTPQLSVFDIDSMILV